MPVNSIEQSAVTKFAIRLVPFLASMVFINYLDRTAISFAGTERNEPGSWLSAAQFGFASGIFFLGYIILEVPSNLALHNFGARVWLARIIVTWGIVANRTTQIKKPAHIAALIPRERLASQLRPSLSRQNPRKYLRPKSRQAIFEPEGE